MLNKFSKILFVIVAVLFHLKSYGQYIDTACIGDINVRYNVTPTPGSIFTWQVAGGVIANGQGTNDIGINWGNISGVFTVNVTETNAANCVGNVYNAKVFIQPKPVVSFTGPDTLCNNQSFTLQVSGANNYTWNNGNTGNALFDKAVITKTYFVIGSNLVCAADTAYKTVFVNPKPNANFMASINSNWLKDDEVVFTATDNSITNWTWELNGQNLNQNKAIITHVFNEIGLYKILLIAENKFNCYDTAYISREVFENLDVYVPTAFTPNNDNLNDIFEPVGVNFLSYFMQIFDHFGGLIYEGTDKGWDGNYQGNMSSSDNYSYKIIFTKQNGKKKPVDGNVMLVR